jgi:hypothetical protein
MSIFKLYHDAGLTNPVEAGDPLVTEHNADGSTGNVDTHLYFGSDDATKQAQASSNPGVDQIALSIADTAANGHANTVMKLATSQAALDAAVAGAALNLGVTVPGGAANKVDVWVRVNEGAQSVTNWSDLELQTNELKVTAL